MSSNSLNFNRSIFLTRKSVEVGKKAVETVENKKHVSHRFHSTATAAAIYFLMKTTWLFLTKLQKIIDTTAPIDARRPLTQSACASIAKATVPP